MMNLPAEDWLRDAICIVRPIVGIAPKMAPAEAALVANAVARRRGHFASGRACAHEALRRIGHPIDALLRHETGAPAWPRGCVGAISHCDGMAAAIVARDSHWQALGIDIEPDQPLPDDVATYALTASEIARISAPSSGLADFGLLAFSAKECVHKCLHPLRAVFLEFNEVEIDFSDMNFQPRPLSEAAKAAFSGLRWQGQWLRAGGYVWTVLAVSQDQEALRPVAASNQLSTSAITASRVVR